MIQLIFNPKNLYRQIQLSGLRSTGKFSIQLMTTDQLLGLQRILAETAVVAAAAAAAAMLADNDMGNNNVGVNKRQWSH